MNKKFFDIRPSPSETIHYSLFTIHSTRGFTLLEILIYTAIFAVVGTLLTGIVTTVTRVEVRGSASAEVSSQLNFTMQTLQRLIRDSSAVIVNNSLSDNDNDAALGSAGTYLHLRMRDSAGSATDRDPVVIWIDPATNIVKLRQGSGGSMTTSDMTTDKVAGAGSAITFKKFSNPPGHDVVQVDVTLAYNATTPVGAVARTLQGAVGRVSAATFDSDLLPGTDNVRSVGTAASRWVNGYFSGNLMVNGANSQMGVGVSSVAPNTILEVGSGGYLQFDKSSAGAPPANDCNDDTERGRMVIDTTGNNLYICNGA
ncbi:MAG: prepilin-type N-terminal cleavage/methylation domain-containing protein, partial [Candidatus Harrisonbacteria bacterium]|nr:prepilin-type N-terminal cleavage/methylation domain-containing protein [Candidatus Harrisonbacteria bacterium]